VERDCRSANRSGDGRECPQHRGKDGEPQLKALEEQAKPKTPDPPVAALKPVELTAVVEMDQP
jgi:hypothetical protein